MDDTSPDFNGKKRIGSNPQSPLDPRLVELVKFLARISAQRDYNRLLQEQNKTTREPS
jgi:hypothetical protein